jgi:hypothetical protein
MERDAQELIEVSSEVLEAEEELREIGLEI